MGTLNWICVVLLVPGAVFILRTLSHVDTAALLVVGFLICTFLLTAIFLSRGVKFFARLPIWSYQNALRRVALICNFIWALTGVGTLAASIATRQSVVALLGTIMFDMLLIVNVIRLWGKAQSVE
ncbi:hypothetical protein DW355_11030 [Hylemonella gracilis]|uniref:Uncharacterized protein n=1 Tax=Hylemonella gracilis TaxID=80880 RepID=A0A4V1A290_9BURK|nr:hypothetical protein DW355_11030 [Hylemonella gracilis]